MNAKSKIVDPVRGTSTLVRPKFSEGLLLNDDDLTLQASTTREISVASCFARCSAAA